MWLSFVTVVSGVHRWRLGSVAAARHPDAFAALVPPAGLVGGLWCAAPPLADVWDLDSACGSLVAIIVAAVVTNAIVAFAASLRILAAFSVPTMAGTTVTYMALGPRSLALVVPLGCLLIVGTSLGYNRSAHTHHAHDVAGRLGLADLAILHRHEAGTIPSPGC